MYSRGYYSILLLFRACTREEVYTLYLHWLGCLYVYMLIGIWEKKSFVLSADLTLENFILTYVAWEYLRYTRYCLPKSENNDFTLLSCREKENNRNRSIINYKRLTKRTSRNGIYKNK